MREQKAIITISGGKKENIITYKVEWIPKLDLKNEENNHKGVVQATVNVLKSLVEQQLSDGEKK